MSNITGVMNANVVFLSKMAHKLNKISDLPELNSLGSWVFCCWCCFVFVGVFLKESKHWMEPSRYLQKYFFNFNTNETTYLTLTPYLKCEGVKYK